jgi:Domain of unknown function (DUF4383)
MKAGLGRPTQWYCAGIGLFLLIRSATTLFDTPSFATPGDGWRAVLQLVLGVMLFVGLPGRVSAAYATAFVGLTYAALWVVDLCSDGSEFGLIPVDSRDHVVHPLLAVLALAAVARVRLQMRISPTGAAG